MRSMLLLVRSDFRALQACLQHIIISLIEKAVNTCFSALCTEDYRRTACISLLKYVVERGETTGYNVQGMSILHTTVLIFRVDK